MFDTQNNTALGIIVSVFAGGVIFGIISLLAGRKPTGTLTAAKDSVDGVANHKPDLEKSLLSELTTGVMLGADHPSRTGRKGKCRTCGKVWLLTEAKMERLDWDGVYAYIFYCPLCFKGTGDPYYYTGQLKGRDGNAVIDQYDWIRK